MHPVLIRILKQGIPVALILAVVGFVLSEAAGMWFAMQSSGDSSIRVTVGDASAGDASPGNGGSDLSRALRMRLPFTLAAWGFGIVAVCELIFSLLRSGKPAVSPNPAHNATPDAEVERLLNQLLQQAETASAAKAVSDTPAPGVPCPAPQASENSPIHH